MRKKKKYCLKRYFIFAKRSPKYDWSDWTQVEDIAVAKNHVEKIRQLGFLAMLKDGKTKEVLISD